MTNSAGFHSTLPTWVKIFAAVAATLLLLFVGLHLSGRGFGKHSMHVHTIEQGERSS